MPGFYSPFQIKPDYRFKVELMSGVMNCGSFSLGFGFVMCMLFFRNYQR